MSARSRRQTLGAISTSQGNVRSNSNKDSTRKTPGKADAAVKRRQSALPSVGGRKSTASYRQSLSTNRMSMSRMSMSTSRQSSIFAQGKIQDPRPIGDKKHTQANIKTLINYLTMNLYDRPVNPKMLAAPTGKDFRAIITFLFQKVDPNFEFGDNFEEEVKTYMKLFGYPGTISKAALQAVGSPHTWPYLLAALVWFVEFLQYEEKITQLKDEGEAVEGDEGEQLFFNYIEKAYADFLAGQDDFKAMDQELQKTFDDKDKQVSEQIEKLQRQNDQFALEIGRLKGTENEIEKQQNNCSNMVTDIEKFSTLIEKLKTHKATLNEKLEEKQAELVTNQKKLQEMKTEKDELERLLEKQEFTPLEVQEMHHKKSMLQDAIGRVDDKKVEVQQEIWENEKLQSRRLGQIEKAVKAYNEGAMAVHMVPATAKFAKGVDFELKLDRHKATARDMVNLDLTKKVKPALTNLKAELNAGVSSRQRELRDVQEREKATGELRKEHSERVEANTKKLEKLNKTLTEEKHEMEAEMDACVTRVESIEFESNRLRTAHAQDLKESENQLQLINNALVTSRSVQSNEKQQMVVEVQQMSEQVLRHKMNVTKILKQLAEGIEESKANLVKAQEQPFNKVSKPSRPKTPSSLRKMMR
mmetsp:Transcript_893/g.1747  ORF Transcript_893/g.1747 Transcript_893/m.1747 type:complete len:642 (-) Transcript_893:108-2033(-)|eukprot:CAMPEP_0175136886 /NCGR_PEP_ID=MMETSP0087-20121206/9519_1 /TAXON_ID=136419 /ORGANISM="Unknown Unknown, Strain D1" /LENGTH=641 /DNA_ID=CAMNT_0016419681 /DNA_START=48 /DNA_END=1973 /DNA_ORIENTATION=+